MKTYLVTGATGFLGRHLVGALLARGDGVVAVARGHEPRGKGAGRPASLADLGARTIKCDVLDGAALALAMAGCDGVFHCAGLVSRDAGEAAAMQRVNVGGTRAVIDAAKAAGVGRIVIASTSGTVGISEDEKHVATEESATPLELISRFPYYRTKLFAEEEALGRSQEGLEVISVNPSLLLGPGDVFGSSTGDVRLFLDGAIPASPAGGMSYVDARDAADALVRAMDAGKPGRRYLIGGSNVTVREFMNRLARITGLAAPRMTMPRGVAVGRAATSVFERVVKLWGGALPVDPVSVEMGQLFWYISSARAERELGWKARDPMDTLVDTVDDIGMRGGHAAAR
jgi:dihydroflavonol-4-reductase